MKEAPFSVCLSNPSFFLYCSDHLRTGEHSRTVQSEVCLCLLSLTSQQEEAQPASEKSNTFCIQIFVINKNYELR